MNPRPRIRVEHHPGHYRPYRIISDPWEEGKPATIIALTQDEAAHVRDLLKP